jgi:hypothetical protein
MSEPSEHLLELFSRLDVYWRRFLAANPAVERGGAIDMQWVAGVTRLENPWRLFGRMKTWLLREHGIQGCKRGESVYMMTEEEQAVEGAKKERKAIRRKVARSVRRVGAVDPMTLDDTGREVQANHLDLMARMKEQAAEPYRLTGSGDKE